MAPLSRRKTSPKDFVLTVVDGTACFTFNSVLKMTLMFEPVSVYVEGKTSTQRIGHNFPMSKLIEYVRWKGKRNTDLISIVFEKNKTILLNSQYIIAYLDGDVLTKRHELQHARFYIDRCFRERVENVWRMMDGCKRQHIEYFLKKLGYPEHVWVDEFQAYYLTEKSNFFGITLNLDLT